MYISSMKECSVTAIRAVTPKIRSSILNCSFTQLYNSTYSLRTFVKHLNRNLEIGCMLADRKLTKLKFKSIRILCNKPKKVSTTHM